MGTDNDSSSLSLDLNIAQVTTANRVLASSSTDRPRFCYTSTIILVFPDFVGTRLHTPIIVHAVFFFFYGFSGRFRTAPSQLPEFRDSSVVRAEGVSCPTQYCRCER